MYDLYLTHLIFLPNNNLVMTKFGTSFESFDCNDCGWVGGWVVGVSNIYDRLPLENTKMGD